MRASSRRSRCVFAGVMAAESRSILGGSVTSRGHEALYILAQRLSATDATLIRQASTSVQVQEGSSKAHQEGGKVSAKRFLGALGLGGLLAGGAFVSTRDPGTISSWSFLAADIGTPFVRLLDPETAHELAVWSAQHGLTPVEHRPDPPSLSISLWGRPFSNPLGLAAGFDKDARAADGTLGMGFGFVEIGSVTPVPQPGNPKPRVFRLPQQKAVINRYGFNSQGIVKVAERLGAQHGKRRAAERPDGLKAPSTTTLSSTSSTSDNSQEQQYGLHPATSNGPPRGYLGVNLGKNKFSEDAATDFVMGVHTLSQYADYLVINVSSPNTPGLRKLQARRQLQDLIRKVLAARDEMQWGEEGPPPLLLKIAPDLSPQDMADIAAVALSLRLDGLIIGNTTVSRPDSVLGLVHADEPGGLSGPPLRELSTQVLREMYRLTKGKIPLVGCGGINSGADAYEKIRAGASLVQIYTCMVFDGPGVVPRIKAELAQCLERDGFTSLVQAVGVDHRQA